jgi:ribosomal protein L40E
MVSLLCFSCDHRNPIGSRFCNACGTPMNFRPCRHCSAINVRAAAHCHKCGETFDLAFLFDEEADPRPRVSDAATQPVEVSAPPQAGGARSPGFVWTRVLPVTVVVTALATLLVALAPSQAPAPLPRTASPLKHVPSDASTPVALPDAAARAAGAAVVVAAPVRSPPAPEAAMQALQVKGGDGKATAKPPQGASKSTSRATSKRTSAGTQRRSVKDGRNDSTPPRPDPRRHEPTVVAMDARSGSLAAGRSGAQAGAEGPTAAPRPCAEGTMPEPGCDLRLPKGN